MTFFDVQNTTSLRKPLPLHSPSSKLVVHVCSRLDTILGELGKLDLEALLNRLENSLIIWAAHKRDAQTLGSETTGTTDTVKVSIGLVRHIVVDCHVDTLDIDTTAENISRDADTGLELLELLVTLDSKSRLAQTG